MGKSLGANKDIEKLARAARKQGWTVEVTRGNHVKFIPPDGGRFHIGSLTGCQSGDKKFAAQLKKAGLQS